MRLKVIGMQMEGDDHGKKLLKPRKNTFIEDVVESAIGKIRVFVMVRPCNMSKKGEDDIATIWNTCREACKDSNMRIMFKKNGIRFLVSSRSPWMEPKSLCKENFSSLNIHQFGPDWNPKMFYQPIVSNFYTDVNSSLSTIDILYKKIEKERRSVANKVYTFFAAIGDREKLPVDNFLGFNDRYPEYDDVPTMRECIKASWLRPFLLGICKKSSRNKLIETLSIYPFDNTTYKDELVERHIDMILENKLYDSKLGGVDDDEVNRVGELLDFYFEKNVNSYKDSMLQHACHYLQTYCKNYE